jgi:hypothetical protein
MMKVLEMKEREDGGADLQIDMTEEERCFMIEFGFNQLLKQSLNMFNEQFEPEKGTKNVKSTSKSKR